MSRVYGGMTAEERVAQRRERLLDAALEEFGTRGVLRTGVKDICRRAGLTDRYLYESFRDTGELFAAVFERATTHLFGVVAAAVAAAPPTPGGQIRAAVESFVRALADDPRLARVVFAEAGSAGPEVEQRSRATLRQFAALMAATARELLGGEADEQQLQFGALAGVGAIERVMIEWQDGELDLTIDELIDFTTATLVGGFELARRTR
jgi:AcrR family transcriptional regulator